MASIDDGGDIDDSPDEYDGGNINPFEEASDLAYQQLGSLRKVILDNMEASKFSEARSEMSRRLHADEDLRNGYVANIAMAIYDRANSEPFHVGEGKIISQPYDFTNIEYCNAIANDLLRLIFD